MKSGLCNTRQKASSVPHGNDDALCFNRFWSVTASLATANAGSVQILWSDKPADGHKKIKNPNTSCQTPLDFVISPRDRWAACVVDFGWAVTGKNACRVPVGLQYRVVGSRAHSVSVILVRLSRMRVP